MRHNHVRDIYFDIILGKVCIIDIVINNESVTVNTYNFSISSA